MICVYFGGCSIGLCCLLLFADWLQWFGLIVVTCLNVVTGGIGLLCLVFDGLGCNYCLFDLLLWICCGYDCGFNVVNLCI